MRCDNKHADGQKTAHKESVTGLDLVQQNEVECQTVRLPVNTDKLAFIGFGGEFDTTN